MNGMVHNTDADAVLWVSRWRWTAPDASSRVGPVGPQGARVVAKQPLTAQVHTQLLDRYMLLLGKTRASSDALYAVYTS